MARSVDRGEKWAEYGTAIVFAVLLLAFAGVQEFAPEGAVRDFVENSYVAILLAGVALIIAGGGALLRTLSTISNDLALKPFPHLHQMLNTLSHSQKIAEVELRNAVDRLEAFHEHGVLVLHGRRAFQAFWIRAMHRLAGNHIIATSLPSKSFFWNADDHEVHDAIAENRKHNGTTTRIFLLNAPTPTPEELTVLRAHAELGVEVYYCDKNVVPAHLREIALADRALNFGWKTILSIDDIQTAEIYTRRKDIEVLLTKLETLVARDDIVTKLQL